VGYRNLRECVDDLERHGMLRRVGEEIDPHLEIAEIQRRVYAAGGPAVLFERVKGSPFPALGNLFGTPERARFIFRDTYERVKTIMRLKANPSDFWRSPMTYASSPFTAFKTLPRRVGGGPVLESETTIDQLPAIVGWPEDGGPFVTMGQVYTEDPDRPGVRQSNLGMYRSQLSGNEYELNRQIGLHYQIHRGIGVHHAAAVRRGEPLKVSIFVGGPPANAFAAVMPLPEGMSELFFAGMLGGRRFRHTTRDGHVIAADADFCITGTMSLDEALPEGPFGDHLGYYSDTHDFPYLKVHAVYHRRDAIWPFTVVGRPPQEDTTFGELVHELTEPLVPKEIPGLHAMHAVDAAGVHPLMLAIGSERYVPFEERTPKEILTIANAVLGYGQASLSKYLFIVAGEDDPDLNVNDVEGFFRHMLERVDWTRDLHFQTRTTIDTLDYTGTGLNEGSKLVIAAAGAARRALATELSSSFSVPDGLGDAKLILPGVLVVGARAFVDKDTGYAQAESFARLLEATDVSDGIALIVLVDDITFAAESLSNFLWVTFTRSNPSHDVHGVGAFTEHKHWGCRGPLIIDARIKPHHARPLVEDPKVTRRVDELAASGGPLHGVF